jgi:protein SCO1/2
VIDANGAQHTARNVLIGVLALGIALTALVLVVSVNQSTAPETAPAPRLTNTPNIGAGGITPLEPGDLVPAFTLPASTGSDLSLSDFAGQYVFLYFGYTNCPDYCPTTMAKWVQVKQGMGDGGKDVAYVMISIDPRRDTPEVLADYLSQFDPAFIGLQANEDTVQALAATFGLAARVADETSATAEATEATNAGMDMAGHSGGDVPTYLVDHTIASYLLDPKGNLRAIFTPNTPAADMRAYLETIRYADGASTPAGG